MSLIKDNKTTTKPPSTSSRTTSFLGCFGFSGDTMHPTEEVNPSSRRRQRWLFKWKSSFRKSAVKTVPVELTTTTTVHRKTKSFTVSPATSNTKTWEIQVVEEEGEDATLTKKPLIMVDQNHSNYTRRKKWIDVVKRQNGSYRSRRKDVKAAAVGPPYYLDSPEKNSVTISHDDSVVFSPKKELTESISPPPGNGKRFKPPRAPPAGGGVDDGVLDKTTPLGGGFDSIIGMSIILVTLVIMMLWGKLCAILCTSAWFFIAPSLAAAAGGRSPVATAEKRRPESRNVLDLESVEYKKKVVLEGLLQRNHRNGVGRL